MAPADLATRRTAATAQNLRKLANLSRRRCPARSEAQPRLANSMLSSLAATAMSLSQRNRPISVTGRAVGRHRRQLMIAVLGSLAGVERDPIRSRADDAQPSTTIASAFGKDRYGMLCVLLQTR
jgi:hypothetical protein